MDSIAQQVTDALGIMILGMGLVFIFLSTLILGVKLVAWKFGPKLHDVNAKPTARNGAEVKQGIDPKMVAVITAAIHQHRAKAQ
ncbi:OadG family protein [Shewanella colwelliana]|uniref:Probable oxaloacetate decarboxylase gamma chain n=1 Tax=Shewanella colwelliana TaxID=23 RepID=A0A1E5IXD3_SHECO|nr:OadG family protein [Shewanella colwelliana]MDX1281633.1 OadG family protein [Shewanella colwelliana]OEG75210.1 sodium pump decarboxylase subunit gamma [Shewanella colwelliana]